MPQAKALLISAVKAMRVEDDKRIMTGGEDSATKVFSGKTRAPLSVTFSRIVTGATEKVSLADKYDSVADKAVGFGLLNNGDANIQQYVAARAFNGFAG